MADLSLLQEDLQEDTDGFGVDDYSSESDVIIIPSALDFVSQDEMLTPLGRLDKYAASENVFNRANCESRADGTGASYCIVLSRKPAFNPICFFQILTTYCG
uniref:Protein phosphatase 4 regulatory subunit 1 n=1 Tax=Molossus molossus TaxID=27622 RepID=A0A7J8HIP5_MOLMO|nr:protein phosphatase 4 regulatory subunit 1 [Molossus molossus]